MLRAAKIALPALLLLAGSCKSTPSTILLSIEAKADVPTPDALRLSVYSSTGMEVNGRRVPASGTPELPDDLVLFPNRDAGEVRILVRAMQQAKVVGEGAALVSLRAEEQVTAMVVISSGQLPDLDRDWVPDVVDNCPSLPNPKQGPCPGPDGGADICDRDKDGYKAKTCGGDDCNDNSAAANPGKTEGPHGGPTCSDGLDNDCDGATDTTDTGCVACKTDADCDDSNTCTTDSCGSGGNCVNAPTNEGLDCDDGNACTLATTCAGGACSGGSPVVCPDPGQACKSASCDTTTGCGVVDQPDGTKCDDGTFCTDPDSCAAGVCKGSARDCNAGAPTCQTGTCDAAANKCVYSPVTDGKACSDGDACTQGESCKAGACTAPATLLQDVDSLNVGIRTERSLAADSGGKLHTCYHTYGSAGLKYATNAGGSWKAEAVTSTGTWSTVLIGLKGEILIVYAENAAKTIKLATRTAAGSPWKLSTLLSGDGHCGAVIDAAGKLHISFQQAKKLYYVTGVPSSNLKPVLVDSPSTSGPAVGYHSSLALDAGGKVHIAHGIGTSAINTNGQPVETITSLRYSTNVSGSWKTTTPAGLSGNHGGFASIAVRSGGEIFISHTSGTDYLSSDGVLYVTSYKGGKWSTGTLASAAPDNAGTFSSLRLNSKGDVLLTYRNQKTNQLRFATNTTGSWVSTTLDTGLNNSNGWASMVQLPSGQIHITYEGQSNSKLRHAALSGCP